MNKTPGKPLPKKRMSPKDMRILFSSLRTLYLDVEMSTETDLKFWSYFFNHLKGLKKVIFNEKACFQCDYSRIHYQKNTKSRLHLEKYKTSQFLIYQLNDKVIRNAELFSSVKQLDIDINFLDNKFLPFEPLSKIKIETL